MSIQRPHRYRAAATICAGLLVTCCARTTVQNPLDTAALPGDAGAGLDFWHALPTRSAISNDEALHGLVLFAAEADSAAVDTYQARIAYAKERGWLAGGWDEPADTAVQRGIISSALAVICGIEGGVMMRLVGPIPRYAHRELVFEGIMPATTELQTISGLDFIGVISKAQDYLTLKQARADARATASEDDDGEPDTPPAAASPSGS